MQVVARLFFLYLKPKLFSAFIIAIFAVSPAFAQPANDNCASASIVTISGSGYGHGTFTSTQDDMTAATLQTGETFAASINTAGLNKKSVWYKFTLPTTRGVRISLLQQGSAIQAGNVGFAVYKSNTCLPADNDISNKLTAIETFGNTYHPCVELGDYYIQVSGNNNANGPVYITVETSPTTGAYDRPVQAYDLGVLTRGTTSHPLFNIGCHSLEDGGEICNTLGNYQNYTKSTWHVFTTPAYLDYLNIVMGGYPTAAFKFGFKIYQGDVRSAPYSSLPVAWGCDSLVTDGYSYANRVLDCSILNPGTTYSLQLFYDKNYNSQITLDLLLAGQAPTIAPEPILSAITPTTNNLGVLPSSPAGIVTTANDNLACNARHAIHPCEPSLPAAGVIYNGDRYKLSSFFLFTLPATSNLSINATGDPLNGCRLPLLVRLFKQNVSNSCTTLDTANIVAKFITGNAIPCLPPGNYTLQVMGSETITSSYCPKGSLGSSFTLSLTAKTTLATNKFSLATPWAFDTLNRVGGVMQPLTPGITYTSKIDTFGCANTVRPFDIDCSTVSTKAMYREFIVPDSGVLSVFTNSAFNNYFTNTGHKIYKGDANGLAIAQSAFSYPNTITGLTPQTLCLQSNPNPNIVGSTIKTCVLPGTYTHVNFGNSNLVGESNIVQVRLDTLKNKFYDLAHAEDMGNILSNIPPIGGTITSVVDYFSCKDNAIVIDGIQPCKEGYGVITGTKASYRQFYLSSPASISISNQVFNDGSNVGTCPFTIFKGKATDGIAALTAMPAKYRCIYELISSSECDVFAAGWYTVVTYGWGPTYANPMRDINSLNGGYVTYGGGVGSGNRIIITVKIPACPMPKYNRPYKAAIDTLTNQPFLLQWAPRVGHTAAYPKTDTTYTLYTENFNCSNDTPFASHPVVKCNPASTKVAYWVFRITQESFISIMTENYWNGNPYGYTASVYAGNARNDSALFATAQPIQPCLASLGHIQLCKLQPGTYTIILYAPSDAVCKTVTPKIYIDQVGYSRFDHANNAYDFGQIKPDSNWYSGKQNDVNPLNPGRAASNDFFYCTTGAQTTDPTYGCASVVLPNVYQTGNNIPLFTSNYIGGDGYTYPLGVARNLWYTFTVDKGGLVKVRVKNKTIGKDWQYNFHVFKSNVDGTLPFGTVVSSGGVDSTYVQGLELVASNTRLYCDATVEASFFRETCTPIPERYYIIVSNRVPSNYDNHNFFNPEWMYPNHQVEVEVLFDSVNAILPKFDHYAQANSIGTNLGAGTYTGLKDNISCATRDATDPVPPCGKTLWYKFSTSVSGVLFPKVFIEGQTDNYFYFVRIYKEIISGDSTSNGLQFIDVPYAGGAYQTCISPGTYYFVIQDCGQTGFQVGNVYPQITITENAGDFCSRPVIANLTGAGSKTATASVSCHTIGPDYGEFNPTLTCPPSAITKNYKSTWYRLDITGTDTLDITVFLNENTSVGSTDIKYRMMTGNCNAMQEQSCVQDALTRNTYKCLAPGKSYYIQVFSPLAAIGSVELNVTAVKHADSCQPQPPCIAVANFSTQFDCTKDQKVSFINSSTYGTSIQYNWDFGYNNQSSTAVVPQFYYPALTTAATYTIRLIVTNTDCGKKDTAYQNITIPARAVLNLGNDTSLCNGGTLLLNATSYAGATYQWNTGATSPTIIASTTGQNNYIAIVTYNGCISRDTIRVNIDPINPVKQYKYVCGTDPVLLNASRGFGEGHRWNTGATTASISVFATGIYWDDMQLNGCTTRDSFIVSATALALGNDRPACFGTQPVILNATTAGATGYTWQNGSTNATFTAPSAGLYWVDIAFANCTLRDTIILTNLQLSTGNINAAICQGNSYTLPSGKIVNTGGVYTDTSRTTSGCDSLINTVNLVAQNANTVTTITAICPGQSYTLPWGTVVNTSGIYRDTLRYNISGCDSVRRTINLTVQTSITNTTNATICAGQSYTLPWGTVVNTAGVYRDTLRYSTTGCDSLRRVVNLALQSSVTNTSNATICAGQTYTLPWGTVVNTAGVYGDTLRYVNTGCDSVRKVINLTVQSAAIVTINTAICAGQTYTLPWGTVVTNAGIYRDTLRYNNNGCDSVRRTVNLSVGTAVTINTNAAICTGQTYTLPWGTVVNTAGVYRDTLRSTTGNCDSLLRVVNLAVQSSVSSTSNAIICAGQSYTLPWGTVVNTAGVYRDTLRYSTSGCDSVRRTITLAVQSAITNTINPVICSGQTYTLPWGKVVNTSGIYRDTIRFIVTNCDSLYRVVNLTVQSAPSNTTNAIICAGQTYRLPSGIVVNTAGIYRDTLKYNNSGCDSIYRVVNLTVQPVVLSNTNTTICFGQTYTLPWGTAVNTAGIYRDTLRYNTTGCDSVRRTINLAVQTAITNTINPVICSGQTYTLPWGRVVNTSGIYRDTARYTVTGCDSLYRVVNLTLQSAPSNTTNAIICAGQTYRLPSGILVNATGVYRDTLKYSNSGCDSIYRVVNLTVQSLRSTSSNATICAGQTYALPWGTVVNASGIYGDTIRYSVTGCDSLRRLVNLAVQAPVAANINAAICAGQSYTLPWGTIVNTTGIYRDTMRYINTGCDSVRRTVNLTVQVPAATTTDATICAGQSYVLPTGSIVTISGIYRDTLRYTNTGCDSLRRTVNLTVQSATATSSNAVVCAGQTYTLPWGTIVNTTGIYRDTLRYAGTGCDSVRRTVSLLVQAANTAAINATICAGNTYTLPWGAVANVSGIYKDTLRYTNTNCDSLIRIFNLAVTPAAVSATTASICAGETYTLPWGTTVSNAGIYRDTVRTPFGCDSMVRAVTLSVKPVPSLSLTKSNDINCIIGIANLAAAGGLNYVWWPASSLSDSTIRNPVASPNITTVYHVKATNAVGCIKEDSIIVRVNKNDVVNGFLLPTAFTPNGDGLNDCFGVRSWGNITNLKMEIYDRWGRLIFITTNPTQCWDGNDKTVKLLSGAFIYQVSADTNCGRVFRKGTVMLVR